MPTPIAPHARPSDTLLPVHTRDASVCVTLHCRRVHVLVPTVTPLPVGACGSTYPHALEGCVLACTLAPGHDGNHEEHADAFGSIRAWEA